MAQVVSDTQRIVGQVTAMAMLDEAFRARLEATPLEVLREYGMDVPGTARISVVSDPAELSAQADDDTVLLFVPNSIDLSEEELSMVAGAAASCQSTSSTFCTLLCLSCVSTASTNSCS